MMIAVPHSLISMISEFDQLNILHRKDELDNTSLAEMYMPTYK